MNVAVKTDMAGAREAAYALPIEKLDPAQGILFQTDTIWPYFERLRKEDPVHFTAESEFGPYWSITKYNDIMAVDTNHQVFSSESLAASPSAAAGRTPLPMFIAMDPPKHDVQRKAVTPVVSPANLAQSGADHPRARRQDPRRSADRRDLRLGRQGLDRTDHHDAGDPVRLSVRGAPQADLLVRCRHAAPGPRHGRDLRSRRAES